jgi:hypothetical protein
MFILRKDSHALIQIFDLIVSGIVPFMDFQNLSCRHVQSIMILPAENIYSDYCWFQLMFLSSGLKLEGGTNN